MIHFIFTSHGMYDYTKWINAAEEDLKSMTKIKSRISLNCLKDVKWLGVNGS